MATEKFKDSQNTRCEGLMLNGVKHGKWKYFHKEGSLLAEVLFKDGHLVYTFNHFLTPGGNVIAHAITPPDEGRFNDTQRVYNKVSKIVHYLNGVKDSISVSFYPNGKKKKEENYSNGKLEGDCKAWYPDGTIKRVYQHSNGQMTGPWKFYNEKAILRKVINYKGGYEKSKTMFDEEGKEVWSYDLVTGQASAEDVSAVDTDYRQQESDEYENEPLAYVMQMPEFPGGEEEKKKFLKNNFDTTYVTMNPIIISRLAIAPNGAVLRYECVNSRRVNDELYMEVLRVIALMPHFQPAVNNGKKVMVWNNIDLTFKKK